jgi:hypothetical protein
MDEADGDGTLVAEITAQAKDTDALDRGETIGEVEWAGLVARCVVDEENFNAIGLTREGTIKLTEELCRGEPVVAKGN